MELATLETQWTADVGRTVYLRPGTSDRQVWADTFTGRYHLPPDDMPAPATVLDLGSNIGLTVAHYAALWPEAEIVGVELDEDSVEVARLNNPAGVVFQRCAVSANGGWGVYDPRQRAEAFAFVPGGKTAPADHLRAVSSYTLRQLIRRNFLVPDEHHHVDFVKMDVEGEEWPILMAALEKPDRSWANLVGHLLLELHPTGDPDLDRLDSPGLVAAAIERLEALGFHARHHPPHPRAVYAWR